MGTALAGEHDLLSLAAIVNEEHDDLPEAGVPLSLLSDLKNQIPCDCVLFQGYDTRRNSYWFAQQVPTDDPSEQKSTGEEPPRAPTARLELPFWEHYWDCKPAATQTVPAICKTSSRSRTSTQYASFVQQACIATFTGHRVLNIT